jgi:hypothetical protein
MNNVCALLIATTVVNTPIERARPLDRYVRAFGFKRHGHTSGQQGSISLFLSFIFDTI